MNKTEKKPDKPGGACKHCPWGKRIEVYKFDSGVVLATPEVEVKAKTDESLPPWKR